MSDVMQEWETAEKEAATPLNLEEMDGLVQTMIDAEIEYNEKKAISTEAYHVHQECKAKVLNALVSSGRDKYHAPGIGLVSTVNKMKFVVPTTLEAKRNLFDYIKENSGPQALMGLVSINYNTLNSWAKKELESNKDKPEFTIPGLEEPTEDKNLRFKKDK